MHNDFRQNGLLRVRCLSSAERRQLLEAVESIGIPVGSLKKGSCKFSTCNTNAFEINIKEKTINDIGQPFTDAVMRDSGVRLYSVSEFCRLAELEFSVVPRFLLWHVPHDGQKFPAKLLASVRIPREDVDAYHEKMRDTDVGRLIPDPYHYPPTTVHFDISRMLCDVERFIGPEEVMERYGMGYCYERAYDGTVIKEISDTLKSETLRYYSEHHRRMDKLCESHPHVLLFDMHSYSDEIVPADFLIFGREAPDLCIGTDTQFTPAGLFDVVNARFKEAGFTVAQNYPYSGCYIPNSATEGRSDCISIMLEFNKRVYLSDDGSFDKDKAGIIQSVLREIIVDCVELGKRHSAN